MLKQGNQDFSFSTPADFTGYVWANPLQLPLAEASRWRLTVFQIQNIDSWKPKSLEYVGAKAKYWFIKPVSNDLDEKIPYLFKEPKENTGEDWSEIVAFKAACLLGLPCASYQLATWLGKRGVISPKFLPPNSELIDGTELIVEVAPDYENKTFFKRSGHTLDRVLDIIENKKIQPPIGFPITAPLSSALGIFIGYLILDALVGNGDRHDQNWAAIRLQTQYMVYEPGLYLAPTFDHAACLGRELPDADKLVRLTTKDQARNVESYLGRNKSAFYQRETDKKTMMTIDAFKAAGARSPVVAEYWKSRLEAVSEQTLLGVLDEIPTTLISGTSVKFSKKMLQLSRKRILAIDSFI